MIAETLAHKINPLFLLLVVSAAFGQNLEYIGEGDCYGIYDSFERDSLLYLLTHRALIIKDFSLSYRSVGYYPLWRYGIPYSMAKNDSTLYLTIDNKIITLDISTPVSPSLIEITSTPAIPIPANFFTNYILVKDSFLVVESRVFHERDSSRFFSYKINHDRIPVPLSYGNWIRCSTGRPEIDSQQGLLLVGISDSIYIWSLYDLSTPLRVFPAQHNSFLVLDSDTLLWCTGIENLVLRRYQPISAIETLYTLTFLGSEFPQGLSLLDNYIYCSFSRVGFGALFELEISDRFNPHLLCEYPARATDVIYQSSGYIISEETAYSGGVQYITTYSRQLCDVVKRNWIPRIPTVIASRQEDLVYLCAGSFSYYFDSGIFVVDISDVHYPYIVNILSPGSDWIIPDLTKVNDYLYCPFEGELVAYDLILDPLLTSSPIWRIGSSDSLYMGCRGLRNYILATEFIYNGDYLLRMDIFDARDFPPRRINTFSMEDSVAGLVELLSDSTSLYYIKRRYTTRYDLSDPIHPVISRIEHPAEIRAVYGGSAFDGRVFLSAGTMTGEYNRLLVVDFTRSESYSFPVSCYDTYIIGEYLITSDLDSGLSLWDISSFEPRFVQHLFLGGPNGSYITGVDSLIFFDMSALLVIRFNPPAKVEEHQSRFSSFKFEILPSPTNSSFIILFNPGLKGATFSIYNILGNKVWERKIESTDRSSIVLGTRDFPAGLYFLTLKSQNQNFCRKLIILR